MTRLLTSVLTAFFAVFFMAGCVQTQTQQNTPESLTAMTPEARTTAMLQQPMVDDIYMGNVAHFSEFSFGGGGDAFGLMRVLSVTDDTVVLVTEDAAWPETEGAFGDLKGDFSDITWDYDEEITVKRADLANKLTEGHILEARRLTAAEIQSLLD